MSALQLVGESAPWVSKTGNNSLRSHLLVVNQHPHTGTNVCQEEDDEDKLQKLQQVSEAPEAKKRGLSWVSEGATTATAAVHTIRRGGAPFRDQSHELDELQQGSGVE